MRVSQWRWRGNQSVGEVLPRLFQGVVNTRANNHPAADAASPAQPPRAEAAPGQIDQVDRVGRGQPDRGQLRAEVEGFPGGVPDQPPHPGEFGEHGVAGGFVDTEVSSQLCQAAFTSSASTLVGASE